VVIGASYDGGEFLLILKKAFQYWLGGEMKNTSAFIIALGVEGGSTKKEKNRFWCRSGKDGRKLKKKSEDRGCIGKVPKKKRSREERGFLIDIKRDTRRRQGN